MDGLASGNPETPSVLSAAHILLVEDSFLILMELESILVDAGAAEVSACRSVSEALRAIDERDVAAAILDVRLDRETSLPVARALSERGVPFFFYTAQLDTGTIRAEWPGCQIVSKPADSRKIVETVASLMAR